MEAQGRFKPADFILLAAIWLFLIARCAVLGGGFMWLDEIYSFRLIHDPSTGHMLQALGDQADASPPLYYLLARGWSAFFSDSPMSLRMFSTLGFCAGLTIIWLTLRKAVKFLPAAFTFALVLGGNQVLVFETLNARFYGQLFALISLAIFLAVKLTSTPRPRAGLLMANALVSAALVLTHPLGGIYSAAILGGVVASDLVSRPPRIRVSVILSYVGGWAALLLWLKQFLRQSDITSPHGWTLKPGFRGLVTEVANAFGVQAPFLVPIVLGTIFSLWLLLVSRLRPPLRWENMPRGLPFIALSLFAIIPLLWIVSRLEPAKSVFVDRYFVGVPIGGIILVALLAAYSFDRLRSRLPRVLPLLVAFYVVWATSSFWKPVAGRLSGKPHEDPRRFLTGMADADFGHLDLPIVCPRSHDFVPRNFYALDKSRYYFLLNWPAAAAPGGGPSAVVDYKVLSAAKRYYPGIGANIVDASDFLREHPVFLLQDVPESHWPEFYLNLAQYRITPLDPRQPLPYGRDAERRLLLVEKLNSRP